MFCKAWSSEDGGDRTHDPLIKSELLYRLSYVFSNPKAHLRGPVQLFLDGLGGFSPATSI